MLPLLKCCPVLACVLLVNCSGGQALEQSPPRSFQVGVTTRIFVDTSRPTPPNGLYSGSPNRRLKTEIWYPADSGPSGEEVRDASVSPDGPFPLVLFVHGSLGFRRQSTFLTQALAQAGYVVAAADFPFTMVLSPGGESDWHVQDQIDDLAFLSTTLFVATEDPSDALEGAIDRGRGYAVVGHSTGGTVALLSAFAPDKHDQRVSAAVSLSGDACFFGENFFSSREVPLLVITGSRDLFVPAQSNGLRTYHLARSPKILALLIGGSHLFFTDFPLPDTILDPHPTTTRDPLALTLTAYGGGEACEPIPPPGADPLLAVGDQHALTVAWTRAFLDGFMRDEWADLARIEATKDPRVRSESE